MISSSKLKLEPGEAFINPLLRGVARITKRIGDREYRAWVDAHLVGTQDETQYLQCFPRYLPDQEDPPNTASVTVNEWTTWKIPSGDFNSLEWLGERIPVWVTPPPGDERLNDIIQQVKQMNQGQEIIETPLRPQGERTGR